MSEATGQDWFADVFAFHRKFAPHVPRATPTVPPGREAEYYGLGFIEEEVRELRTAMGEANLSEVADALADIIYVAIRAALIWGIDLRPIWDEVHRTNMAKVGGHLRPDGKILKPPGWEPPRIAELLEGQGPIFQ